MRKLPGMSEVPDRVHFKNKCSAVCSGLLQKSREMYWNHFIKGVLYGLRDYCHLFVCLGRSGALAEPLHQL